MDDKGNYTPQTMAYMVKMTRDVVGANVKIEVHCHDDFGLALANSLESVRAGAGVVDCVLNGGIAIDREIARLIKLCWHWGSCTTFEPVWILFG
jgi:hypothetical protein